MNNNGHPKDPTKPTSPTNSQSDDERLNLTLRDMEETAHYQGLSDLALIATVLEDDQLSLDPRVYELMSRIYPDWINEDYRALPSLPPFISIAIPYQVAYDVANFSRCHCSDSSDKNTATISKPCVFCATKSALHRATKNPAYSTDEENNQS
jgi:hypothetical protein